MVESKNYRITIEFITYEFVIARNEAIYRKEIAAPPDKSGWLAMTKL